MVEMLVSISILLLVIVGPMTITVRTAKSATFASEQVQAFFFAQEGLELAQKGRDDLLLRRFLPTSHANYLANPWAAFISTAGTYSLCYNSNGCGLEWSEINSNQLDTVVNCGSPVDTCLLKRDTSATNARSTFTYSTVNSVNTIYTRRIYFTKLGDDSAVQVRSVVSWRTGSLIAEQQVVVETYLYNIYAP